MAIVPRGDPVWADIERFWKPDGSRLKSDRHFAEEAHDQVFQPSRLVALDCLYQSACSS